VIFTRFPIILQNAKPIPVEDKYCKEPKAKIILMRLKNDDLIFLYER